MTPQALELYFYMCSPEPIIEWLEEEKVKTFKEALAKLGPAAQSNMLSIASQIGRGNGGSVTAGGMVNCLKLIEKHYENKKK